MPGGVDPSLTRGVGMIGAGSEAMTTAALMMNFAAMNNPLMSQLVLGASQPKFKGTVENFPEFKRQWNEYMRTIKSSFPALAGSQLVNLLKACLDAASVLQLRRELEDNPDLTAEDFMFILERDFGRDCAMQAREEWAAVQLHHGGSPLTSKDWRTFQQKFEIAASRVEDKGEREEYDMLFKQLSSTWREKIIKMENSQQEGKNWYRVTASGELSRTELEQFLEYQEIEFQRVEKRGTSFLVKVENAREGGKLLRLHGETHDHGTIRVTRASHTLSPARIFEYIGDYIRVKEDAAARSRDAPKGSWKVHALDTLFPRSNEDNTDPPQVVQGNPPSRPRTPNTPTRSPGPSRNTPDWGPAPPLSGPPLSTWTAYAPPAAWNPATKSGDLLGRGGRSVPTAPATGKGKGKGSEVPAPSWAQGNKGNSGKGAPQAGKGKGKGPRGIICGLCRDKGWDFDHPYDVCTRHQGKGVNA